MKTIPFIATLLLKNNFSHGPLGVVFMLVLETEAALLTFIRVSNVFSSPHPRSGTGLAFRAQSVGNHGPAPRSSMPSLLLYVTTPSTSLTKDEGAHVQVLFLSSGQRS